MDQLICPPLSHRHYWYEASMLKVPAIQYQYLFVYVVSLCESSQVSGVTTEIQNGECSVDG